MRTSAERIAMIRPTKTQLHKPGIAAIRTNQNSSFAAAILHRYAAGDEYGLPTASFVFFDPDEQEEQQGDGLRSAVNLLMTVNRMEYQDYHFVLNHTWKQQMLDQVNIYLQAAAGNARAEYRTVVELYQSMTKELAEVAAKQMRGQRSVDGTAGGAGAVGMAAMAGMAGSNGTDGSNGMTGAVGGSGAAGTAGGAGSAGTVGAAGEAGAAGAVGAVGAAGAVGAGGTTGVVGGYGDSGSAEPVNAADITRSEQAQQGRMEKREAVLQSILRRVELQQRNIRVTDAVGINPDSAGQERTRGMTGAMTGVTGLIAVRRRQNLLLAKGLQAAAQLPDFRQVWKQSVTQAHPMAADQLADYLDGLEAGERSQLLVAFGLKEQTYHQELRQMKEQRWNLVRESARSQLTRIQDGRAAAIHFLEERRSLKEIQQFWMAAAETEEASEEAKQYLKQLEEVMADAGDASNMSETSRIEFLKQEKTAAVSWVNAMAGSRWQSFRRQLVTIEENRNFERVRERLAQWVEREGTDSLSIWKETVQQMVEEETNQTILQERRQELVEWLQYLEPEPWDSFVTMILAEPTAHGAADIGTPDAVSNETQRENILIRKLKNLLVKGGMDTVEIYRQQTVDRRMQYKQEVLQMLEHETESKPLELLISRVLNDTVLKKTAEEWLTGHPEGWNALIQKFDTQNTVRRKVEQEATETRETIALREEIHLQKESELQKRKTLEATELEVRTQNLAETIRHMDRTDWTHLLRTGTGVDGSDSAGSTWVTELLLKTGMLTETELRENLYHMAAEEEENPQVQKILQLAEQEVLSEMNQQELLSERQEVVEWLQYLEPESWDHFVNLILAEQPDIGESDRGDREGTYRTGRDRETETVSGIGNAESVSMKAVKMSGETIEPEKIGLERTEIEAGSVRPRRRNRMETLTQRLREALVQKGLETAEAYSRQSPAERLQYKTEMIYLLEKENNYRQLQELIWSVRQDEVLKTSAKEWLSHDLTERWRDSTPVAPAQTQRILDQLSPTGWSRLIQVVQSEAFPKLLEETQQDQKAEETVQAAISWLRSAEPEPWNQLVQMILSEPSQGQKPETWETGAASNDAMLYAGTLEEQENHAGQILRQFMTQSTVQHAMQHTMQHITQHTTQSTAQSTDQRDTLGKTLIHMLKSVDNQESFIYNPATMVVSRTKNPAASVAPPAPPVQAEIETQVVKKVKEELSDIQFVSKKKTFTTVSSEYEKQVTTLREQVELQHKELEQMKETQSRLIKLTDTGRLTESVLKQLGNQLKLEKMRRGL